MDATGKLPEAPGDFPRDAMGSARLDDALLNPARVWYRSAVGFQSTDDGWALDLSVPNDQSAVADAVRWKSTKIKYPGVLHKVKFV